MGREWRKEALGGHIYKNTTHALALFFPVINGKVVKGSVVSLLYIK